jgi:predicted aspartyl protease
VHEYTDNNCFHFTTESLHYGDGPENVDPGQEEEPQVLHLHPGEKRGWWKTHDPDDSKPTIALVHGAVCDRRVAILLDSGASTSIISLNLARELGLKLEQRGNLSVRGLGGVTTRIRARTTVKVTLGHRLVYHVEVWVGNIGGEVDCLLGMEFMKAAGVRLNVQEGKVSLPEEESVPLVATRRRNCPKTLGKADSPV